MTSDDFKKMLGDHLIPMIEKMADKTDIARLERKIDNFTTQVAGHGRRLDDIEALPTIAHQQKGKN